MQHIAEFVTFEYMTANEFNFNVFNSIILAGIIQGFVFGSIVLANKKYRSASTMILAAFIISFSLDNLQYLLENIGFITEEALYAIYFVPFSLLSGPLFLLYGLYVLKPERQFTNKDKLLFLPFLIACLICVAYKILYALDYIQPSLFFDIEAILEFVAIAIDIPVLIYLCVRAYRLGEKNADTDPQLTWFRVVLVSLLLLSAIWFYIAMADYFYDTEYWYVIYIGMSVIIYWMGHIGIYKFGIEQERKKVRSYSNQKTAEFTPKKNKNTHIATIESMLVDNKRFLDPTMTLDKIAEDVQISKFHLSRIINSELGMGFPDYLNSLRVKEAKLYLRHPDFAKYTLLAIGLEAGFNSKTAFNTAFKKFTSQTPSQYRTSQISTDFRHTAKIRTL